MNPSTEISEELWTFVRRSYESEAWANAILDSIHHFGDTLRSKSGLQSDGTTLVGQAFGGKDPKIKLNRLVTESDKNIQAGVEQLARGLYQAVRNPRSHERIVDTKADCDAILMFVDYLLRTVGHSKDAFSIEAVIERISDSNFVQGKRYSELILNDIPQSKRLDALIAILDHVDDETKAQRKHFIQACLSSLSQPEAEQFYEVISTKLRTSYEDDELRVIFQILEPSQWLHISETARLRSEHRIIKDAQVGTYIVDGDWCQQGAVATWAGPFLGKFSLKSEFVKTLSASLRSNSTRRQAYVLQFFFERLPDLAEKPPISMINHLKLQLEKGDRRYKDAIESLEFFGYPEWTDPLKEAMKAFKPSSPEAIEDDFKDDESPS